MCIGSIYFRKVESASTLDSYLVSERVRLCATNNMSGGFDFEEHVSDSSPSTPVVICDFRMDFLSVLAQKVSCWKLDMKFRISGTSLYNWQQ